MIKHPIVGRPHKNKVLILPTVADMMPPARDPNMNPILGRVPLRRNEDVLIKLLFHCHLLIHEASSNVAEIPSVPCTTEYVSVDDKPDNDPATTEDSDATIAQRTLFRSYMSG